MNAVEIISEAGPGAAGGNRVVCESGSGSIPDIGWPPC